MPSPAEAGPLLAVVSDLWRFPVKSFAGERLKRVFVGPFGLLGDRRYCVFGPEGPLTARRQSALLGFTASYRNQEAAEAPLVVTPAGRLSEPAGGELREEVAAAVGHEVTIEERVTGHFDAAPLHLLGEASVRSLGDSVGDELDRRRFRANILVDTGEEPFAEDAWIGSTLTIGAAAVDVVVNTERCAVTTFDPETRERDPRVLAALARERENLVGVYAMVRRPGWIAVGDQIRAVRHPRPG